MQLIISLTILTCLTTGEINGSTAVSNPALVVMLVILSVLLVPGFAAAQAMAIIKRQAESVSGMNEAKVIDLANRTLVAFWVTCSLIIVVGLNWANVVRVNWQFEGWFLIDELLILGPVVLPLMAAWAVMFDIEKHQALRTVGESFDWRGQRFEYVLIRFKVYLVLTLVPLFAIFLARDICFLLEPDSAKLALNVVYIVLLGALVVGFPRLLTAVWNVSEMNDNRLRSQIVEAFDQMGIKVKKIKQWNTSNRIANALVAGILPRYRIVFVTDRLLSLLLPNELQAVMRHEASHLRSHDLAVRAFFLLLPLALVNLVGVVRPDFGSNFVNLMSELGFMAWLAWAALPIVYVTYLVFVLGWLSRQMEYDADLSACLNSNQEIDMDRYADFSGSLLKLATETPSSFYGSSWLHPSIHDRLVFLQRAADDCRVASKFRKNFFRGKVAVVVTAAALVIAVLSLPL